MGCAMKTCFKCGESKSRSEFYKHPQMADGLLGKCKDCTKQDNVRNREKRIDYYRAYDRRRAKEGHGSGSCTNVQRRAHNRLSRAVEAGKVSKPSACSCCGDAVRLYGHHDDYDKPLEVRWLCQP